MMSRRQFDTIAGVLRETTNGPDTPEPVRQRIVGAFADELRWENPRFDRERFMAACEGQDSHDSAGRRVRYSA